MTDIGTTLAEARRRRGWSLREAERRSGVPNAHISQIETGTIRRPSVAVLSRLAVAYRLSLVKLSATADREEEAGFATDLEAAVKLLEQALFLRTNGERPPGAPRDDPEAETWRRWDRDAETFLRGRAGLVRAYECGTTEPAAPREAAGGFPQVSGGGSGI